MKKLFFRKEENREFNLILVDYENPTNHTFEVTEEYYLFDGQYSYRSITFFVSDSRIIFRNSSCLFSTTFFRFGR